MSCTSFPEPSQQNDTCDWRSRGCHGWALGWLGSTTLVIDLAGSKRVYPVRGRNAGLHDFSEAICERLMSLKR